MKLFSLTILTALALAGCGGGNDSPPSDLPDTPPPVVINPPNDQPTTPTCNAPQVLENGVCVTPGSNEPPPSTPTCTPPRVLQNGQCVTPQQPDQDPPADPIFAAQLTSAPADGAQISGTIQLAVSGVNIRNVELLPPVGYTPMHGRFQIAGNNATLSFNTTTVPDGDFTVRISAFNTPPGSGEAEEIVVMTRTWKVRNNPNQEPPPPTAILPHGQTDASKFTLTFQDEFNGSSLDLAKWNTKMWYEGDNPRQNYAVEGGVLKMWSVTPYTKMNRTVDTDGKFEQRYGYYEARLKLNDGAGQWPAFWLYGHPGDDRPEIDIMEAYPGGGPGSGWGDSALNPINYGVTLHKANSNYSWHETPFHFKMGDHRSTLDLSAAFHTYAVDWRADGIQFYFDGQPIGPRYNNSDGYFSKQMYVVLDLWLGSASGEPNGSSDGKQNSFEVDYVRVWQHR